MAVDSRIGLCARGNGHRAESLDMLINNAGIALPDDLTIPPRSSATWPSTSSGLTP